MARPGRDSAKRAAGIWALFLLALTSWPSPPSVPVLSDIPSIDKFVHGLLYGVEGWLLYRAIRWPGRTGGGLSRVLCVVGALAAFGTLDETHQAFIPGRSMEGRDALMDTAGAALGASVAAWMEKGRKGQEPRGRGSGSGVRERFEGPAPHPAPSPRGGEGVPETARLRCAVTYFLKKPPPAAALPPCSAIMTR